MTQRHRFDRIVTSEEELLMVVTDLHGDWDAYSRCKTLFLSRFEAGKCDHIVFCGDLIHRATPPEEDASLKMLLDLKQWQSEGPGRVTYLLGNHELAQLYRIDLRKGNVRYTPRLAAAMGPLRRELIDYLGTLPFFVRTSAGVAIAHAGVGQGMLTTPGWETLVNLDHQAEWDAVANDLSASERREMREQINRIHPAAYDALVKDAWNIDSPDDPFYDDLLISNLILHDHLGHLLWGTFFTQNEREYGDKYPEMVAQFLAQISQGYQSQNFLLTGHIGCPNGYTVVNSQQLRLASAAHAKPRKEGKILHLDGRHQVKDINALATNLQNLF